MYYCFATQTAMLLQLHLLHLLLSLFPLLYARVG